MHNKELPKRAGGKCIQKLQPRNIFSESSKTKNMKYLASNLKGELWETLQEVQGGFASGIHEPIRFMTGSYCVPLMTIEKGAGMILWEILWPSSKSI